jgi:GWxTD domain-containing protein
VKRLLYIALGLCIIGCSLSSGVATDDYSYLYNRDTIINPEFKIYHTNSDTTEIIFKINSGDLIYSRANQDSPYKSRFKIHYRVYEELNSKIIIDSSSLQIIDINPTKQHKLIFGKIKFPFSSGQKSIVKITTTDQQRNQEHKTLQVVDKESFSSAQNFLVVEEDQKLTRPYITSSDSIQVYSFRNKNQSCILQWFNRDFGVAKPPFSVGGKKDFDYMPDDYYNVQFNARGIAKVQLPEVGFVFLQRDTNDQKGLTLFRFDRNYPEVFNANGLAEPLRYICSNEEYDGLLNSDNQKLAVEQYWIEKCKSKDRAREIIKEFYSRVNDANTYFTSYIEGWKTDRGMVSMIYGKPASIEKRSDYESWSYGHGPEYQAPSLVFTFYKKDNPFSQNDYRLKRDYTYKQGWYRALETWRAGRIYKAGI